MAAGLGLVLAGPVTAASADVGSGSASTPTAERLDVSIGGWAENALVLPDGDILVSNLGANRVQRIDGETHEISTVAEVAAPGGLAVDGTTLYVVTGNSPTSVATREGGVLALDLASGERRTVVAGLGEANGLTRLPGGDLAYTVTLGHGMGVHRVDPDTGKDRLLTSAVPSPNGIATGPDGRLYVGSTMLGTITRVDAESGARSHVGGISVVVDDFAFLPDGRIVAATFLGFVDIIDPQTGRSRPVGAGNLGATSAGPAPGGGILVTTATGRVTVIEG
ncbi:MAG: SMP-30/gluconolactonase/LRE family protein [Janibacter sp.]